MSGKRAVGLSAGRGLDPHIALKQESNLVDGLLQLLEIDTPTCSS